MHKASAVWEKGDGWQACVEFLPHGKENEAHEWLPVETVERVVEAVGTCLGIACSEEDVEGIQHEDGIWLVPLSKEQVEIVERQGSECWEGTAADGTYLITVDTP